MRKIVSLICALALVFTVFTFVASADDNNTIVWAVESQTESQTVISFTMNTTYESIAAITLEVSLADAYAKGAGTIAVVPGGLLGGNVNASKKLARFTRSNPTDTDNDVTGNGIILGKLSIDTSNVTTAFTLSSNTLKVTYRDSVNETTSAVADQFSVNAPLTVNPYEAPSTTTVQFASDSENGDATYFLGADGGEYGSAFRITFERPAAATSNDAIFGVTAGGTRKYSPKQTGVLFGLSGTVTLDVSFLNGSTEAGSYKKNGEAVAPKEVTAASVIMSDGEGNFFYTDEADAK